MLDQFKPYLLERVAQQRTSKIPFAPWRIRSCCGSHTASDVSRPTRSPARTAFDRGGMGTDLQAAFRLMEPQQTNAVCSPEYFAISYDVVGDAGTSDAPDHIRQLDDQ